MTKTTAKLPAIQFYPGDWKRDLGVQALDFESRGIWFEMLLLMHDSEDRGKLTLNGSPMTEDEIAHAIGCDQAKFQQTLSNLLSKGVASRCAETGAIVNRRMLRDERLRTVRAEAGSLGGKRKASKGDSKGLADSTPSSSSSVSSSNPSSPTPSPEKDGKRRRRKKSNPEPSSEPNESWGSEPWGTVKAFVALYNEQIPQSWPPCKTVDDTLSAKILEYVQVFPRKEWWEEGYRNIEASPLLSGPDFRNKGIDFLLRKSKDDGLRNCVKVHDGKYL